MTVFGRLRMPSLGGATEWLNTDPLGPAELRGHVVLVNFWTLTCINIEREPVSVEGVGVEAEADWDHLRTPETHLGYALAEQFASPDGGASDESRAYELPEHLRFNHWALAGVWTIGREKIGLDQAGGSIAHRFHARDAHLVLSSTAPEPIPFLVLLDGQAPGASHGEDIDKDGNGVLRDGRLYQLAREHDAVRERTMEITFLESGAEAFVFTFG
jgi:hypothetical protein